MRKSVSALIIGVASTLGAPAYAQVQDVDIAVVTMDQDDAAKWLSKSISERVREVESRILSKDDDDVKAIRVRPDDQYRGFNRDEGLDLPTSVETINGAVRVGREVTVLSGFSGRYRFVDDRIEVSVRRSWVDKWRKKKGMRYPFVVNAISEGRTYALDAPNVIQLNRSEETIKGKMAVMYVAPASSLDAAIARKGQKRPRKRAEAPRAMFGAVAPIGPIALPDVAKTSMAEYAAVKAAPTLKPTKVVRESARAVPVRTSHVQLGAYPNAAAARAAWVDITRKHEYLASLQRADRQVDLNGHPVYRLRVVTAGYEKAKEVCSRLKDAGDSCFVAS